MRIQYDVDGGCAYFPGLHQSITLDTNELPPKEADKLEHLIEAAGFFDLPAVSPPPRGVVDYPQYTISVTASKRSHTVRLTDPIENPPVRVLVDYLEEKTRELHTEL